MSTTIEPNWLCVRCLEMDACVGRMLGSITTSWTAAQEVGTVVLAVTAAQPNYTRCRKLRLILRRSSSSRNVPLLVFHRWRKSSQPDFIIIYYHNHHDHSQTNAKCNTQDSLDDATSRGRVSCIVRVHLMPRAANYRYQWLWSAVAEVTIICHFVKLSCQALIGTTFEGCLVVFSIVQNLVGISIAVLKICKFHCYVSLAWKCLFMLLWGSFWGKMEKWKLLKIYFSRNAITWRWCPMDQKSIKVGSSIWSREVSKNLDHKKWKLKTYIRVIFCLCARTLPVGRSLWIFGMQGVAADHWYQLLCQLAQGFWSCDTPILPFSIGLAGRPYNCGTLWSAWKMTLVLSSHKMQ